MSRIAISGGTGSVGRAVVRALTTKPDLEHSFIILTRSVANTPEELKPYAVAVDYSDIDSLVTVLEKHNIDTVISTVNLIPEGAGEAQLNLIKAAEKASVTKRFIPSEFSVPTNERVVSFLPYHTHKIAATALLKETSLEYTIIHTGAFLDHWGHPFHATYASPVHFWLDMAHNAASVPAPGNTPVVLTHTFDIAAYIVAMLSVPAGNWPKECAVIGDRVTVDEVVAIAQEVKGVEFDVVRDERGVLEKGVTTDLPVHEGVEGVPVEVRRGFLAGLGIMVLEGDFNVDEGLAVNGWFPGLKTRSVRDVLGVWKGK
ncbi:NAD(P)-binding protein [Aspergillus karnatakaensis]|uniref:NAD(P)-binding protein n=1 Tax=Aspergillus karnatakaensis TaxID=1810916 RepID=UPI003CCD1CB3